MKHVLRHTAIVTLCLPVAVLAEDVPQSSPQTQTEIPFSEGLDLLRGGAELLMQDLLKQIEPTLNGLEDFALELEAYEAPVILPNGDILIRRKTPMDQDAIPKAPTDPLPRQKIEVDPMPSDGIDL